MAGRSPAGTTGMESHMDARPRRAFSAALALVAVAAMAAIGAGTAGAETVYNNIPSPLPGNFASVGLEATSSSEFGGEIELAGTARAKPTVTVVMSSWACEKGSVEAGCETSAKSKGFKLPVTIKVYTGRRTRRRSDRRKDQDGQDALPAVDEHGKMRHRTVVRRGRKRVLPRLRVPDLHQARQTEENAAALGDHRVLPALERSCAVAEHLDERTVRKNALARRTAGRRMVRQLDLVRHVLQRHPRLPRGRGVARARPRQKTPTSSRSSPSAPIRRGEVV